MFIRKLHTMRVERFLIAAAARKIQRSWRKKKALQLASSPQVVLGSALKLKTHMKSIAKQE